MEGVVRPQNSKNSKKLVQDFLAKGLCLTGVILLAGPVRRAAWKHGQLDCKEIPRMGGSHRFLCVLLEKFVTPSSWLLSNLSTGPQTGQAHTLFSFESQKSSENRKFFS